MADLQINKPSDPTHSSSSDSKDPDKPSKKRKNLQIHDHQTGDHHPPPPPKRPQKDKHPAKEEDDAIKDTATSTPKKKGQHDDDDVEGVNITDIAVLMSIITFHRDTGVYPFETPSAMKDFCHRWSRLGLASSRQMKAKIEGVKNKYDAGAEEVAKFYGNEKEFELWMKINWGKEGSGDGDGDGDKDKGGCS